MRERARAGGLAWSLVAGVLVLTACTTGGQGSGDRLTVFAAASLADVFTELAEEFEEANPGTEVVVNFAGSSDLAVQTNSGAPADVFASADAETMRLVAQGRGLDADWAAEHGGEGAVFATNTLRIAVPAGNPAGVGDLADLASQDTSVALCAEEVPCGATSAAVLEEAGVAVTPDTYEEDVRAVLTKVELGEVDAGLVYATDIASAEGRTEGLDFAEADRAVNDYLIGVLSEAPSPDLAADWVDLVRSSQGARVLDAAGFGTP